MSKHVFKVSYEIPADLPEVVAHYAAVREAESFAEDYVEAVGGLGFYTSDWDGHISGVIFADLVGRAEQWKVLEHVWAEGHPKAVLCVPKRTKAGAEALAAFSSVPRIPRSGELVKALGWTGARVSDGSRMHYAVAHLLELPAKRVFARIPRQIGDGWEPPGVFREVTEGDYMRAVAEHNEAVDELYGIGEGA